MLDALTIGAMVVALHVLLRASMLVDAGMVVVVDKEDKGVGGGSAPVASRKTRAQAVSVLQWHRGR